jgi:elongation factor G
MLLNAKAGVEVGTELIFEYIERFKTPTFMVINQLDHEKADFDRTLEQAQSRFGNRVLAVQYPYNTGGGGFNAIIDALRMVMYEFPKDGGKPRKAMIPASEQERAQSLHQALVEAAAENDETLMEHFFENGTLTEEELAAGLRMALANQQIFPVFCASAIKNMGSGRIMGFIHDICPSPAERPHQIECDPDAKANVFIYKTISEPNVGNVSYFKVYSGILKSGEDLHNAQNGTTERVNQMFVANGKNRELVHELHAGDIGVTVKLKNSHTNNTLHTKGSNTTVSEMQFPTPRMRVAVMPPAKNDIEKLAKALHTIQEEDPTLQVEHSAELRQMLLHAQGQLHLDIVKYRIEKVYGINMEFTAPRIPYRETITKRADTVYRHKKQSGGAGQFAEVHMRIEPYFEGMPDPEGLNVRSTETEALAWGGHLVFCNCVVGGAIDTKFMSAIKKGIMQKMAEGPLSGSRCRDIRVSVFDGKMHPVDSNDMAFMLASSMAFREGFAQAAPQLLEPIYDLEVRCSEEVMGEVMSDLQTRRAIIMGMDADGHYQQIMARVPLSAMYDYSSSLRSFTQGRAKFSMQFADFQAVPMDIQQRLIAEHKEEMAHEHA